MAKDPGNPYAMYPDDEPTLEEQGPGPMAGERPAGNPAGTVGLILAILGPLAPIGVIVSLMGLRREPKGLAIAGVIVGILMTLLTIGCAGVIGWAFWVNMQIMDEQQDITQDYAAIQTAIEQYKLDNNGQTPPDLNTLGLPADATTSPFQDTYDYRTDGTNWSIGFVGEDGILDTQDDTRIEGGRGTFEDDPFGWQDLQQALMYPIMSGS